MLTAEELCDICGATPAQRSAWAKAGDLRRASGYEELDAVELCVCVALRDAAGPKRGKLAWRYLRPKLSKLVLAGRNAWMVIECRGLDRCGIATTPEELAELVVGARPVVVVNLAKVAARARNAYRDAIPDAHVKSSNVHSFPSRGRART